MGKTARWVFVCLLPLALLASVARAEEEDDDPKAPPSSLRGKVKAPAGKNAADKPADNKITAPSAKPKAPEKPVEKPAAEKPEKPKAAPEKAPEKPKPAAEKPEKPADAKLVRTVEPTPKAKPAPEERNEVKDPFQARRAAPHETPPASGGGRAVRVKLVDGSTVVGKVRAELSDMLVVDCALGLLQIPRPRIAIIVYDGAPASTNKGKRAPVQDLDRSGGADADPWVD
jgi:hypothetical protein